MSPDDLILKVYTLPVAPGDIVVLHLEYEMGPEDLAQCTQAMTRALRARGQNNIVVVLQPGMALTTVHGILEEH